MNNHSKISIIGLLMVLLLGSCDNQKADNAKQKIFYYHRMRLGSDPGTFDDYLTITNYYSHPMTAKELFKIANAYLDTVKALLEVNDLTIMAKDAEKPELYWDSEIWGREKHFCVISFGFSDFSKRLLNKPRELVLITLWNDAKPTLYFRGKEKVGLPVLDSILNSPVPVTGK